MNPLQHKNLVMFSTAPWHAPHWFRRQHFSRTLADSGWNVFYINPRTTVIEHIRKRGLRALNPWIHRASVEYPLQHQRLALYTPSSAWPFYVRGQWSSRACRIASKQAIHRAAKQFFRAEPYIQVLYNPCDIFLAREDLPCVYEIVDKFSAYPEFVRMGSYIEACHEKLCRQSTAIIATTPSLLPQGDSTAQTHFIPNGVDTSVFSSKSDGAEPDDLARIKSPRAVYAGALFEWFDFDLLREVAILRPEINFILLGFHHKPLPPLPSNVKYLGQKKQSELPSYFNHCDCGIIPFRANELTRHVNPLKFYEYAASDLPCVSTPMLPLEKFVRPGVLGLADTAASFGRCLDEAIAAKNSATEERQKIAEDHDWRALAVHFEAILRQAISAPQASTSVTVS